MIDHITLLADNLPKDYDQLLRTEGEYSFDQKITEEGEIRYFDTRSKGLYFNLSPTQTGWKLKIKGSLKSFSNGENYSFMDFKQTTAAISKLAASVCLRPQQFSVTSLEVSVPVATAPIDNLVKSYGKWEFTPMLVPSSKTGYAGKRYGVTAISPHAYFSIKLYQKDTEQSIHRNRKIAQLQQVEFSIDKPRFLRDKLNKAGIVSDSPLKTGISLNDLTKPEVQLILCRLLTDIPHAITPKTDEMPTIDHDAILRDNPNLTKNRLFDLVAFAYRPCRELLKATKSRSHYFELKKDFNRLRDQLCPSSDKELHKFQEALKAAVEAGKPTAPVSHTFYIGKESRKHS